MDHGGEQKVARDSRLAVSRFPILLRHGGLGGRFPRVLARIEFVDQSAAHGQHVPQGRSLSLPDFALEFESPLPVVPLLGWPVAMTNVASWFAGQHLPVVPGMMARTVVRIVPIPVTCGLLLRMFLHKPVPARLPACHGFHVSPFPLPPRLSSPYVLDLSESLAY